MKIQKYKKTTKEKTKYVYMILDPLDSHLKYFYSDRKKALAANRILRNRNFKFMVAKAPIDQLLGYVGCHPEFELKAVLKPLAKKLIKRRNKL